jgi:hypothetical protein
VVGVTMLDQNTLEEIVKQNDDVILLAITYMSKQLLATAKEVIESGTPEQINAVNNTLLKAMAAFREIEIPAERLAILERD